MSDFMSRANSVTESMERTYRIPVPREDYSGIEVHVVSNPSSSGASVFMDDKGFKQVYVGSVSSALNVIREYLEKDSETLMEVIGDVVFRNTGVNRQQIRSRSRDRFIVNARIILYKIANDMIGIPRKFIYRWMNRDHSTLYHYDVIFDDVYRYDVKFRRLYDSVVKDMGDNER